MKRLFEEKLLQWKDDGCRKPLMVVGARQVGKTYSISNFCESQFESFYRFDFMKDEDIVSIFESTIDPDSIIKQIEIVRDITIDKNNTILFFDEIQRSERAIESLKYFCESQFNYKVICAGSLLGVRLSRMKSSFPVGKVQLQMMYPLNFKEFLMACDQEKLIEMIEESFDKKDKLPEIIHKKALSIFDDYLYVGGMPEAVSNYLETKDIMKVDDSIRENLITSYLADMSKYTENTESIKNIKIYSSIPNQLAKDNKKFKYSIVDKSARAIRYESSLNWLISANMIIKSSVVNKIEIPLKAFEDDEIFKIYLNDCGLLSSLANIKARDVLMDNLGMFSGALAENYVACELKSYQKELNYYTFSNYEIDFVLNIGGNIIPIEVKAGKNMSSASLKNYVTNQNPVYSIRLSKKNFGFENNIFSIPLYAFFCLLEKE